MTTMHAYEISSRTGGQIIGIYQGAAERDAILAMTVDAGYDTREEAAEAMGISVAEANADLIVVDVSTVYRVEDGSSSDLRFFETEAEAEEALQNLQETSPGIYDEVDVEEVSLARDVERLKRLRAGWHATAL